MLIRFHKVLIVSAIAVAVLFAMRALFLFTQGGGSTNLVLALVALALAGGLGAYFRTIRPE